MKMVMYHFCAMRQLSPGTTEYFDGTCTSDADLMTKEGYRGLKDKIAEVMTPGLKGRDIILISLSKMEK